MINLKNRGITLIALVITIIVLLILAGVSIKLVAGENGIISRTQTAVEEHKIAKYIEQIDMVRAEVFIDKKGENEEVTLDDLLNKFLEQEYSSWVNSCEKTEKTEETEETAGVVYVKLTTTDGYMFLIDQKDIIYHGKNGEIVDISDLSSPNMVKIEKIGEENDSVTVRISKNTDKSYYKIQYSIDENEWQEIENEGIVDIARGSTIFARLSYYGKYGVTEKFEAEHSEATVEAVTESMENLTRKVNKPISELFNITWGSKGTETVEYSVKGNYNFKNSEYSSSEVSNLASLEVGTYTVTCTIIDSSGNSKATATKNISVTNLASTKVDDKGAKAIYSEYDLAYFSDLVNGGQNALNAKLMNDISMAKVCSTSVGSWNSVGNSTNKYAGVFDGNEKTLDGIYVNSADEGKGLFGYVENATIKNIILNGGEITGTYNIGGICGYNDNGTIDNCEVKNINISATGYTSKTYKYINDFTFNFANVGGIIGYNYNGNVNNCKNSANVSGKYTAIGGIIGNDDGTKKRTISNCKNLNNISSNMASTENWAVGGIIGQSYNLATIKKCENQGNISSNVYDVSGICGTIVNGNIEECKNTGNILGKSNIGGICGEIERISETTISNINKCTNEGQITSTGYQSVYYFYGNANHTDDMSIVGGIVGYSKAGIITECKNKGNITSTQSGTVEMGGIIGVSTYNCTITKCANLADIEYKATADCIGGIAGYVNQASLEECYNIGKITGGASSAGISGGTTYTTVKNCYNTGNISSTANGGGIIGSITPYKTSLGYEYVYNCYNLGETSGASGYTDLFIGYCNYLTWDYLYAIKSVYKSDGKWTNYSTGNFEAIDDTNTPSSAVKSKILDSLLNGNGAGKWTRDTTGKINNGYPYLVNNKP